MGKEERKEKTKGGSKTSRTRNWSVSLSLGRDRDRETAAVFGENVGREEASITARERLTLTTSGISEDFLPLEEYEMFLLDFFWFCFQEGGN